jgi:hypothetical protein
MLIRKVRPYLCQFPRNLQGLISIACISRTEFHPNRKINVEDVDTNLFTPLSEV